MAVGCRIKKNIVRPDRSLVEAFRGIPVANIDDCMNRLSAVQAELCPMNSSPLLGTAFTVKCPAGDNLMFHKALDLAQPGDVLVIAAGGSMSRALCGEIMAPMPAAAASPVSSSTAVSVTGTSWLSSPTSLSMPRALSPTAPIRTAPARSTSPW